MPVALASALDQIEARLRLIQGNRRRLPKAIARGLSLSAARLMADLPRHIQALVQGVAEAQAALPQPMSSSPSVQDLAAELRAIEEEFGALTVYWKEQAIGATTSSITLEDVYLGPFEIRLCWDRLERGLNFHCFAVIALDPHPAEVDEEVTHPHVKNRKLCPGDAASALRKALVQGRLADAFCLMNSVLREYNPGSPHVRLSDWTCKTCHDCGCCVDEDEENSCPGCGERFCNDCVEQCASCHDYSCLACSGRCAVCKADICRRCRHRCLISGRLCCPKCLKACAVCGRSFAKDELDKETGRCCLPSCVPSTKPLTPEEPHAPTLTVAEPATD
jgi:hypothetical protein